MTLPHPLSGFSLMPATPLAGELERLALAEFDRARRHLAADGAAAATSIHECRKSIKRLRALARLVRSHNQDRFKDLDSRLREAGRTLSGARDAEVVATVIRNLAADRISVATLDRLVEAAASARSPEDTMQQCGTTLATAESALRAVFDCDPAIDFGMIAGGVSAVCRQTEKRFAKFRRTKSQEDAHNVRRSLQRHLAHIRLIEPVWPAPVSQRIERLDVLSVWLGEHHDLALLQELIESDSAKRHRKPARLLLEAARKRQHELTGRILRDGSVLFGPQAERFGSQLPGAHEKA